jgi:hypothetical protein
MEITRTRGRGLGQCTGFGDREDQCEHACLEPIGPYGLCFTTRPLSG